MITEAYSRLPLHEALHAAGHAHQPHVHSSVEQQPHAHAHTQQHQHSHPVHDASEPAGILFIENVGNLVCPGAMGLGEAGKVAILSVTEGEDKPSSTRTCSPPRA
jgi:hydrogenase nickel incorporation protein HypB